MKNDLLWVISVLDSSPVRVDQIELHNRLAACVERLNKLLDGMENTQETEGEA